MSKRPDVVKQLPNGWREEIYVRKAFRPDGRLAQTRKIVDVGGDDPRSLARGFGPKGQRSAPTPASGEETRILIMNSVVQPTVSDIRSAANAITARYVSGSARESESAIALLTLWTVDAIEAGRLSREDATDIFTGLDVSIGDASSGPELSERAHELMLEGGWFRDDAIGAAPDFQHLRRVAFEILGQGKG